MFYLFYKTSYLNEGVNCTEPSLSVRLPSFTINMIKIVNDDSGGCQLSSQKYDIMLSNFFSHLHDHPETKEPNAFTKEY